MSRGAHTFKQSDLTRALRGAKAAGVEVSRIKIAKDGTIEIKVLEETVEAEANKGEGTEWDAALE